MNPFDFPLLWWVDAALLIALLGEAFVRRTEAWARPAIAVYLTVAVWYLGDYAYSTPEQLIVFSDWVLDWAFLQIAGFLVGFRLIMLTGAKRWGLAHSAVDFPVEFSERAMTRFLGLLFLPWALLFGIGLWRADWQLVAILWPPSVSEKVGMFVHSGLGGDTGFLNAAAGYVYLAICAFFGVGFSMSRGLTKAAFGMLMLLAWPYFLFDRARNVMLALIMPGILCFALLGRAPLLRKMVTLGLLAAAINAWFLLVVTFRGAEGGLVGRFDAMVEDIFAPPESVDALAEPEVEKHYGLDMLKELCYINTYIDDGTYEVNLGRRYAAEFLNFVPRAVWAGKPMIGIDYAIARGFGGSDYGVGVFATVATGLIGQGVVNFGPVFGVAAAAILIAVWALLLARLWTQRQTFPRAALFVLGLGLTFNMGRDITLLVLWPFVFAYIGVRLAEKRSNVPPSFEVTRIQARKRVSSS
jgi:hypothetical protein